MGLPAEKRRLATYAHLEAVPSHLVAEIINGELRTMPRPAPKHAKTSSVLGMVIGSPYGLGVGGPGGWMILDEPELHLGPDVLVPDLAGWRLERMPELPETAYFELAPDWVCEVLSISSAAADRAEKMPIYARENVQFSWLIDPILKTLEVFILNSDRRWLLAAVHRGEARVRAEPFDAIELDLALLWAK
jgi:Uma2 family endonuclease